MVSSELLLSLLGKPASSPEVVSLLRDLGLGGRAPTIVDDVSSDIEVPKHGVALFFRTAHHLRNVDPLAALPPATPVLSDFKFSRKGFGGGPGYDGALPRGLAFTDSRSAARERLGPPAWSSPVIYSDRWDFGEQYMTAVFALDQASIKQVACGLSWTL
jgi:hypothetical protein